MSTDVEFRFGADFTETRKALDGIQNEIRVWGQRTAAIGVSAFAAWGASAAFGAIQNAIGGLQDSLRAWVDAAADAEQVDKRLEIAVRNAGEAFSWTADQLAEAASALQRQSTFGDEAIKQAQTLLVQFRLTGDTFKQTQQLAIDMASALGQDVTDAAATLGRALASPTRGVELLRRSGIELAEDQRELIRRLVETGDIAGAQGVLIDELGRRYAGAGKEMADTAQGAMTQVAEVFGDLQEELGGMLLPVLKEALPVVRELARAFVDFASQAKDALLGVGDNSQSMTDSIRNTMVEITSHIKSSIEHIIANINVLIAKYNEWTTFYAMGNDWQAWNPFSGAPMSEAEKNYFNAQEDLAAALANSGMGYADRVAANKQAILAALTGADMPNVDDILPTPRGEGGGGSPTSLGFRLPDWRNLFDQVSTGAMAAVDDVRGWLQNQLDQDELKSIAEQIRGSIDANMESGFTATFEDATQAFRRIQGGVASTDDVPKRQLTALEQQILRMDEQRKRDEDQGQTLRGILDAVKQDRIAVAGP